MSRPREFQAVLVDWLDAHVGVNGEFTNRDVIKGLHLDAMDSQLSATLIYLERVHLAVRHLERGLWRYEGRALYDDPEPGGHDRYLEGRHGPTPTPSKKPNICTKCFIAIPRAMTECETCA